MPSVSAALSLAHQHASFTAPICSAGHSLDQPAEQAPAPAHQGGHADHCPLCVKHGKAFHMPRPPGFVAPDAVSDALIDSTWHEAFHSATSWLHLPSHAPPAHA